MSKLGEVAKEPTPPLSTPGLVVLKLESNGALKLSPVRSGALSIASCKEGAFTEAGEMYSKPFFM